MQIQKNHLKYLALSAAVLSSLLFSSSAQAQLPNITEVSGQGNNDWNLAAPWGAVPTSANNYVTTTGAGSGSGVVWGSPNSQGRVRVNDPASSPAAPNPNVFDGGSITVSPNTECLFKQVNGESASANWILQGGELYWANNTGGGMATLNGTITNAANSYIVVNASATGDSSGTKTNTLNIAATLTGGNTITILSGFSSPTSSTDTNEEVMFTGNLSAFTGTLVVGGPGCANTILELNPSSASMPSLSIYMRSNTVLRVDTSITIASLTLFETVSGIPISLPVGTYNAANWAGLGYGGTFQGAGSVTVTVANFAPQTTVPVASPSSVVVGQNTPVTLSETLSSGTPPFYYQWQSNSVNVGTAVTTSAVTNALVVNTTGMALGNYNYTVVVTNSYGSTTSAPVTLSVVLPGNIGETAVGFGDDWNNTATWSNGVPTMGNNYISNTNGVSSVSGFGISTVGRVRDNDPSRGAPNPNVFDGGTLTLVANTELLVKQTNGQSASANIVLDGGVIRCASDLGGGTNLFGGSISNAADSYLVIWEDAINDASGVLPQAFDFTSSFSGSNNLTLVSGNGAGGANLTNLTFMFSGNLSQFGGTLTLGNAETSGEVLELNPSNTNMTSASVYMNPNTTLQVDENLKLGTLSVFNEAANYLTAVAPGKYSAGQLAALGIGGAYRGPGILYITTNLNPVNLQGASSLELGQTLLLQVEIPAGYNQNQTVTVTVTNNNTTVASLPGGNASQATVTFAAGAANVQTLSVALNALGTANFGATGTPNLVPAAFNLSVVPKPVLVEAFRASSLVAQLGLNDGDDVSQWAGDTNSQCIAYENNAEPIFHTGVLPSGAPAVDFTNQADLLILTGESEIPESGQSNFTVVVVFREDAVGAGASAPGTQWYQQAGLVDSEILYSTNNQNGWGISIDQTGAANIGLGNPDTTFAATNDALVSTNFHVGVFVFDPSQQQLRVVMDNQPAEVLTNAALSLNPRSAMAEIDFGRGLNNTNYFDGDIAEIDFYNGALNSVEAAAAITNLSSVYHLTFPSTTPPPAPVVSLVKNSNGTFTISSSNAGTLHSTTNLVGAVWQVEESIPGAPGSVTITPSPTNRAKFYRVSVP
jgi:hypothetical protein